MTLGDLLDKVRAYNPAAPLDVVERAYAFSAEVHRGQRRQSGEPYLTHPVQVAGIIADLRLDVPSIATGLLHDTVEDTLATLPQLEELFGEEIAGLVDGVTKIGQLNFTSREEKQAENFRKMLLAMARDIRVILIKLADRTHNMRTLGHLRPEKQIEIAQETLDIYAPLAHRLGIYGMKSELEDNALRFLHPEVYYQLKRNVAKKKAERERYIREVLSVLERKLIEAGLDGTEVHGRPKHFFSIYQKMQAQNLLYDQIYDVIAFRVLTDSVSECYEALGVVHASWRPVPGRFKDYIAVPKTNGYQSLHTTVIGPYGERIEIQIRTREMHRVAEYGIAAHWRYKAPGTEGAQDSDQRFAWLRQMLEWQHHLSDPDEFLRTVKEDLFSEEVFVFTPKGDLLNFPVGSTVIDFAYRIHSEVGRHCAGARVNGKLVPLRYQLQSGDTVEIITTANQVPSKDWLKLVRTSRAKARIRAYIKGQQSQRSVAVGREILERDLGRHHLDLAKLRKDGTLQRVLEQLEVRDEEALLGRRRLRQADRPAGDREDLPGGGAGAPARAEGGRAPAADAAGQPPAEERRARVGRGGHAGALREVLPAAARRAHRGLHHARARGHRARAGLSQGPRDRSPAASRRAVGEREGHAARRPHRGDVRRPAGAAGRDLEGDQLDGDEHRARPGARARRSQGPEHLRADGGEHG